MKAMMNMIFTNYYKPVSTSAPVRRGVLNATLLQCNYRPNEPEDFKDLIRKIGMFEDSIE